VLCFEVLPDFVILKMCLFEPESHYGVQLVGYPAALVSAQCVSTTAAAHEAFAEVVCQAVPESTVILSLLSVMQHIFIPVGRIFKF